MPAINGSDFLLYLGGSALGLCTSATLDYTIDTIDVTTKDNNGYGKFISGLKSGNITFDGFANFSDELSLFTAFNNDDEVQYAVSDTTASTGNRFNGDGILTALNITWDMESPATSSGTIEMTSAPILTTV